MWHVNQICLIDVNSPTTTTLKTQAKAVIGLVGGTGGFVRIADLFVFRSEWRLGAQFANFLRRGECWLFKHL